LSPSVHTLKTDGHCCSGESEQAVLGALKHLAVHCRRMLLGWSVARGANHDARVSRAADDIEGTANSNQREFDTPLASVDRLQIGVSWVPIMAQSAYAPMTAIGMIQALAHAARASPALIESAPLQA
jgi:hypothetical protein